jgi:hypothetical protein
MGSKRLSVTKASNHSEWNDEKPMRCRNGLPSAPVPNHTGTPQMVSMPSRRSFCSTWSTSSSTRATSSGEATRANTMQPLSCRNAYCTGVMVSRSRKRVPRGRSLASLRASSGGSVSRSDSSSGGTSSAKTSALARCLDGDPAAIARAA